MRFFPNGSAIFECSWTGQLCALRARVHFVFVLRSFPIRVTGLSTSVVSLAMSFLSFLTSTSQRCCASLAPLWRMCSCSFHSLISLSSFTFAVLAQLLARLELRNVSFDPLTIRTCRLHHRLSPSVSSLPSTTLSAAFFAALTALAVRILTVIPLVSGSPLRFSSWSSCLRAMVRLYGVSSNGTAEVSSRSASSLPSLLQVSSILLPFIALGLALLSSPATSRAWATRFGSRLVSPWHVGQSSASFGLAR